MLTALRNILKSKNGKIIFSVVWGLGLASIFRRVCKGRGCIIYRAPAPASIQGKVFRFNDKCYSYTSRPVECKGKDFVPHEEFFCPKK